MHSNNYQSSAKTNSVQICLRLLFIFALFCFFQITTALSDPNNHHPHHTTTTGGRSSSTHGEERFSLPSLPSLVDSNIFEKLFKKLEQAIENVVNNVTTNIRFQVSQAIVDVLNKNQITKVTDNAMTAISQNISTLLNNIPFNQLFQNSLQYSQPIITQMAKQFTNQQVIETVKSSLKENDVDFSTIVSEIINATITKLSEPQTKQEINQILHYYATHATDSIPTWLLVLLGSVLLSILMIPSLLMAIILQQVFPIRKMKWYQRIFIQKRNGKVQIQDEEINEEGRHLVYNENVQQ